MVEVSDCLSHLDIAIGFLVSVGGDRETLLDEFMTDTLQMETGTLTPRVSQQSCRRIDPRALSDAGYPQGIWFAQVVNSLILKVKDILKFAAKFSKKF